MEWTSLLKDFGIAVVILCAIGIFIWKKLWPFFEKVVDRYFQMWQIHLDSLATSRRIEMDQLVTSFRGLQETNNVQAKAMIEQVDIQREQKNMDEQRQIQLIAEIRDARKRKVKG